MARKLLCSVQGSKIRLYGIFSTTKLVEKDFPDENNNRITEMVETPLYTGFEIESDAAQGIKDIDGRKEVGRIRAYINTGNERIEFQHDADNNLTTTRTFTSDERTKMNGGHVDGYSLAWAHPKKFGRE